MSARFKLSQFENHYLLKDSQKAEDQFASTTDDLDEEIKLLRAHLAELENEKKAAENERECLQVSINNFLWYIAYALYRLYGSQYGVQRLLYRQLVPLMSTTHESR